MKPFLLSILLSALGLLSFCCSTKKEYIENPFVEKTEATAVKSDTLIISYSELNDDLFGFGDSALTFVARIFDVDTVKSTAHYNEYGEESEEIAGYFHEISIGGNHFYFYVRADGNEFLSYATIETDDGMSVAKVKLGMTKAEVIKSGNLTVTQIPNYLILGDEDSNMIRLEFTGEKLTRILYDGNLD